MSNEAVHAVVFSPHPSDPEFGNGGIVAKWAKEGKQTIYVICTNGDKGITDPNMLPEELVKIRVEEQKKSAAIVGAKEVIYLPFCDMSLEEHIPELKKELVKLILTYRPTVVITCDPNHSKYISNPDHRACGRAVIDVCWPTVLAPNNYRDLLAQGFKPHKIQELLLWQTLEPNYYVDITSVYDIKMAACNCHQSQIGPIGNPDFAKMLPESAKAAGKAIGVPYGESFRRIEVMQKL